jgi:hypothetical protein
MKSVQGRLGIGLGPVLVASAVGIWVAQPLGAQTAGARLAFDVASVRPARPFTAEDGRGPSEKVGFGADRLTVRNAPLNTLFQVAFKVTWAQVGPHPAMHERFDIEAKAAGPASRDQLREMLASLLVDRFKLVMHREAKDMGVYALVIAKGGHKLHEAAGGPDAGWEIVNLTSQIWFVTGTPAVNMTGLTGRYDNPIHWRAFNDPDDPEWAVRAALGSQFGLALERRRAKVEFLVIDHLERTPIEN